MVEFTIATVMCVILLALICQYVDCTIGMGYGTALTPILILVFGFDVLDIVPAVLMSEFISGLSAAAMHHRCGNVNLRPHTTEFGKISEQLKSLGYIESFKHNTPFHLKIAILLALCSIIDRKSVV